MFEKRIYINLKMLSNVFGSAVKKLKMFSIVLEWVGRNQKMFTLTFPIYGKIHKRKAKRKMVSSISVQKTQCNVLEIVTSIKNLNNLNYEMKSIHRIKIHYFS